jgi:hypothetical protein
MLGEREEQAASVLGVGSFAVIFRAAAGTAPSDGG